MARDRYDVDHKPYTLVVRVQGRTFDAVRRAADRAGMTQSAWLRGVIEDAVQPMLPGFEPQDLARAIATQVARGPQGGET